MKISFELSRRSAANANGQNLRKPMPVMTPEHMRAYRMVYDWNKRMMRSYDAAVTDNYNADMRGTFGDAGSEILTSIYVARSRARTITKDTPHGRAVQRAHQNNVVGDDPFRLDMRIGEFQTNKQGQRKFVEDCEINTQIEEEWKRFGWHENFCTSGTISRMEAFRIIEASSIRDGSIIIRLYRSFKFNKYGFAIRLFENDRLQESYMGKDDEGNEIRFSISFDPVTARPIYYWILTRHPGTLFGQNYSGLPNTWRERVPASEIIHFNNLRNRAEQDVGMTEFDATVQPLWRFHQFEKSLTLASIAASVKPFVLEKSAATGLQVPEEQREQLVNTQVGGPYVTAEPGIDDTNDPSVAQQNAGTRSSTLTPGSERELPFGVTAKILDPKFPHEAAHNFRLDNLRDVAIGMGIAYSDVTGDFQNIGFAAALQAASAPQTYFKTRQNNFIDQVVRPLFREWLKSCILKGIFDLDIRKLEDYVAAAKWKAKRWAFVNPLVQAQTLILLLEAKIMSPQQVQDELPDGVSIEDLYTMIAEAQQQAEVHGVTIEGIDVTKPTISKGEPLEEKPAPEDLPGAEGTAKVPPKSKPANPVRSAHKTGKIYILRHGATDFNGESNQSEDRIRGHLNVPLNEEGRVQAHLDADKLQDCGIQRIFTSDLSRARETGEIIGDRINVPNKSFYGLRPWNLGPEVQGKVTKDVMPVISQLVNKPDDKLPGGESFDQFQKRFFETFNGIVQRNKSRNIALVVHYRNLKLLQALNPDGSIDMGKFIGHRQDDVPGSIHEWDGRNLNEFTTPRFDETSNLPELMPRPRHLVSDRNWDIASRLVAGYGDGLPERNGH
ncbi:MAG: phage portal protein [Patescibacteria group bacterium]|nr:phage portal protein [Patescibacteria group bacterium]